MKKIVIPEKDKLIKGFLIEEEELEEHDTKIRAEAVEEAAVLIRQFTREWNMTNHKRISYIASDELISYLRNHMKEQSNAK